MLKFKLEIEGSRFTTLFPLLLEIILIIGKYVLRIGNLQIFIVITTIFNILYFIGQTFFYVYEQPKPNGKYKVGYTYFELPIKKQKVSLFYPVDSKIEPIRGQKYPPLFPQKQDVLNLSRMITYFYLPKSLKKITFICYFMICQFFDYLLKIGVENVFLNEKIINISPEITSQIIQKKQEEEKILKNEIVKKQKLSKAPEQKKEAEIQSTQAELVQYKIIIVETGLGGSRNQHSILCKELASEGFLVFSIQPDDNLEQLFIDPCDNDLFEMVAVRQSSISELIDFITFEEGKIADFDKQNMTIIGWQLGGASALYAVQKFNQLHTFIGLDPWLCFLNSSILKKGIKKKSALIISSQQFSKEQFSLKNFQILNEYFKDQIINLDFSFNCIFKQINHLSFTDLHYLIPIESKYFKGLEINQKSFEQIFILNHFIKIYLISIAYEKKNKQEFQKEFFLQFTKIFPNEKDLFNIIKFIEN